MNVTSELAELIGIHFGDGSLCKDSNYNYTISYSGNATKDKEYMGYVSYLLTKQFGVKFERRIDKKRNCITLRIRSKELFYFYKNCLKIPDGKKTNLRIPDYIKRDYNLLKSFLRGLFDTDGCITIQREGKYKYPLIKICTKHKSFAMDILNSLRLLGIPSFLTTKISKTFRGYDIVVRNKNVKTFFEIIGFNNVRNTFK